MARYDRKFPDGARVMIDDRPDYVRVVKCGQPDGDGDLKIYNNNQTDWSYVNYSRCKPEPTTGEAVAPQPTHSNQEGTAQMANQKITRNLVRVALVDEDAGLDVSKSLVKEFGTFVKEGSEAELIQEILMDTKHNVESVLRAHNAMRVKEVDLDILQRTGNSAKLREVKLKDLSWKVTAA